MAETDLRHPDRCCFQRSTYHVTASRIVEDHRARSASTIDVDNPTFAHADTASTSSTRLAHRDQTGGDVGSTTAEMVRAGSSTHSPVGGRRPVPRHDRQRAADETADSFKDGHERRVWSDELSGPPVPELPPGEVFAEVTHGGYDPPRPGYASPVVRVSAASPRRRWTSNASSTQNDSMMWVDPSRAGIAGRSGRFSRSMTPRPS